ncbi:hypothetical protein HGRIS_006188 [Hohenbuehelia grisea]|uniref:BTB/POZ domain-containing protein n=1 Tax=Hohenbuehelia grisea TaxID=104357 RepID=A0ABR3K0E3_9AGAR
MAQARFIIVDNGTISQSRDESVGHRPLKRPRSEFEAGDDSDDYPNGCPAIGRDEEEPLNLDTIPCDIESYDPEGDCWIVAKDTLFKVDSAKHCASYEWFGDLLNQWRTSVRSRPLGTQLIKAHILKSTSADNFRALLWLMNRSPESPKPDQPEEVVQRILAAIEISIQDTHDLQQMQQWACKELSDMLSDSTTRTQLTTSWSSVNFANVLRACTRCDDQTLLPIIESEWIARIESKDLPPVPAILAADHLNVTKLRGRAYYQQLVSLTEQGEEGSTDVNVRGATQFRMDPRLSNGQVIRLLSGHWSLVSLWERLRRAAPKFADDECDDGKHESCLRVWKEVWVETAASERVSNISSVSVLQILARMRELLSRDQRLTDSMKPPCRQAGLAALQRLHDQTQEGLADHFYGCA